MKTLDRIHLTLNRISYNDDGTPGHVMVGRHLFATLELPWRENAPEISCIPPGTYVAEIGGAPSFPLNYVLYDVPGRSGIVLHSGNFAGDITKGYKSDSKGCVFIGRAASLLNDKHQRQRAVILSRSSLAAFHSLLAGAPLLITFNPPLNAGGTIYPPSEPKKAA